MSHGESHTPLARRRAGVAVLRDCAVGGLLGAVVGLPWMWWLRLAETSARALLMAFVALVVGVPATLLLTATALRLAGVRPVLPVTCCTLLTSLSALNFVHLLQLDGQLGPAWESVAALAAGYAGGVIIGGRTDWRWRVAVGLVFVLLLPAAQFAHRRIVERDLHARLAALRVPLLVPRISGYRISFVNAEDGRLYISLAPEQGVPPTESYERSIAVLVQPVPGYFQPTTSPTPVPVRGLAEDPYYETSCAQRAIDVWSCTTGSLDSIVVARRDGALVTLRVPARGETPQRLLDAVATLHLTTPAQLAAAV